MVDHWSPTKVSEILFGCHWYICVLLAFRGFTFIQSKMPPRNLALKHLSGDQGQIKIPEWLLRGLYYPEQTESGDAIWLPHHFTAEASFQQLQQCWVRLSLHHLLATCGYSNLQDNGSRTSEELFIRTGLVRWWTPKSLHITLTWATKAYPVGTVELGVIALPKVPSLRTLTFHLNLEGSVM